MNQLILQSQLGIVCLVNVGSKEPMSMVTIDLLPENWHRTGTQGTWDRIESVTLSSLL